MLEIPENYLNDIIARAISEDALPEDITTSAIFDGSEKASGSFIVKAEGVIAGLEVAEKVFHFIDGAIRFDKLTGEGAKVFKGDVIAKVNGKASSLLTAERTALNLLQRMSGIATAANLFTEKIKHTRARLLDTRKTAPGLRLLDKLAVKTGGGENHRMGLSDMFLIKDNHIQAAGSLTKAVNKCLSFRAMKYPGCKIEVEVENFEQLNEALTLPVDIIMLDNFSVVDLREAVRIINGKAKTEASGGITIETIQQIAETGVDYISSGALTHSVSALDISLELELH